MTAVSKTIEMVDYFCLLEPLGIFGGLVEQQPEVYRWICLVDSLTVEAEQVGAYPREKPDDRLLIFAFDLSKYSA